jgi:hypothetical protein
MKAQRLVGALLAEVDWKLALVVIAWLVWTSWNRHKETQKSRAHWKQGCTNSFPRRRHQ